MLLPDASLHVWCAVEEEEEGPSGESVSTAALLAPSSPRSAPSARGLLATSVAFGGERLPVMLPVESGEPPSAPLGARPSLALGECRSLVLSVSPPVALGECPSRG